MAGKFGKKGHDRWLGKRITRSHPSRLPPGLLFSDFSVFSNAFLFSYYSPILQTVCGSGAGRALGFGKGKTTEAGAIFIKTFIRYDTK